MSATGTTQTTGEVALLFLRDQRQAAEAKLKRPATVKAYEQLLPRLISLQTVSGWTLAERPYEEIGRTDIAAVLRLFARTPGLPRKGKRQADGTRETVPAGLPKGHTVQNAKSVLGAFFGEMDLAYGIDRPNPARGLDMKRIIGDRSTREKRFLSLDEMDDLVEATTPIYRPIIRLICDTGLRSAEARGLRWCDLDGDVLLVEGQADEHGNRGDAVKTRDSRREVILRPDTVAMLEAHREEMRRLGHPVCGDALVFPTRRNKTSTNSNLYRAIKRAARKAYLPEVGVHDLRHSYAKGALHGDESRGRKPLPLDAVSQQLGHADPSVTASIYLAAKLSRSEKRRLMGLS